MKESLSKLTLAAMLLFATACPAGTSVKGTGVAKTESRTVTTFKGVSVANGVELEVKVGALAPVQVTADDNVLPDVVTEVRDGTLDVHLKGSHSSMSTVHVIATAPSLDSLRASSGSKLDAKGIAGDEVTIASSSGAEVKAEGAVKNERIEASSGASVTAKNVTAGALKVSASSGATISATASESAQGDASSGASLTIAGAPKTRSIKESSGASVSYP